MRAPTIAFDMGLCPEPRPDAAPGSSKTRHLSRIGFLAALLLSISISACGGSKPDPKTPSEEKDPPPASDIDGDLSAPPEHEGDVGDPKPPSDIDEIKGPGEGPAHSK